MSLDFSLIIFSNEPVFLYDINSAISGLAKKSAKAATWGPQSDSELNVAPTQNRLWRADRLSDIKYFPSFLLTLHQVWFQKRCRTSHNFFSKIESNFSSIVVSGAPKFQCFTSWWQFFSKSGISKIIENSDGLTRVNKAYFSRLNFHRWFRKGLESWPFF